MTITVTVGTLADFDAAVANSRRRLQEVLAEQVTAEMPALAALTAQLEQSEAERLRVDAEQRRQAAQSEFENGALAAAQLSFADFHERANKLRAMARDAENLHSAISLPSSKPSNKNEQRIMVIMTTSARLSLALLRHSENWPNRKALGEPK